MRQLNHIWSTLKNRGSWHISPKWSGPYLKRVFVVVGQDVILHTCWAWANFLELEPSVPLWGKWHEARSFFWVHLTCVRRRGAQAYPWSANSVFWKVPHHSLLRRADDRAPSTILARCLAGPQQNRCSKKRRSKSDRFQQFCDCMAIRWPLEQPHDFSGMAYLSSFFFAWRLPIDVFFGRFSWGLVMAEMF